MVRTTTIRVAVVLAAMTIAMLVAYGSASAQSAQGGCKTGCDGGGGTPPPGTPPVVSTKPADGATNVKTKVKIKAKFSEKMLKSSITTATVRLKEGPPDDPDTEPPCTDPTVCEAPYTVKYNKKKKQVTLTPSERLEPNTEYSVLIEGADDTDGLSVKDKAGNPLAEDYTWTFTTDDGCRYGC